IYHVVAATVPLYFALILAYISVKWWKLFTPQQCAGINKFVAKFSIPLLSSQVISESNLHKMNIKLILADFLQKTLPNTLILGIPLLKAMYGDEPAGLLAQIVVLQSLIWYNLLLFMFEFNAAKPASEITPTSEDIEDTEAQGKEGEEEAETRASKSKIMLIFLTVEKKLVANPNTHAAWLGLIWAGIRFRWEIKFPAIIQNSLSILASGGLVDRNSIAYVTVTTACTLQSRIALFEYSYFSQGYISQKCASLCSNPGLPHMIDLTHPQLPWDFGQIIKSGNRAGSSSSRSSSICFRQRIRCPSGYTKRRAINISIHIVLICIHLTDEDLVVVCFQGDIWHAYCFTCSIDLLSCFSIVKLLENPASFLGNC
ncbi:hypothetical protein Golob_003763, partial [Gossypium lobatum]|nr:hypothetical protein [Gossypium lobatum]